MHTAGIRRTHLAILLSLIGVAIPWQAGATLVSESGTASTAREATVRGALGLSVESVPHPSRQPKRAPNATTSRPVDRSATGNEGTNDRASSRWDAETLGLARPAPARVSADTIVVASQSAATEGAEVDRMRAILGLNARPLAVVAPSQFRHARRGAAATVSMTATAREDEGTSTIESAPSPDTRVATSSERDVAYTDAIESTSAPDVIPLVADLDASDVAPPHRSRRREPRAPQRQPDRDPAPATKDTPTASRRDHVVTTASLLLPPEDVETLDETLRIRLRGQFRLQERADVPTPVVDDDPLMALLQVITTREEVRPAPPSIIFVAQAPEDPRATAISAGVFRHVAESIELWASTGEPVTPDVPTLVADASATLAAADEAAAAPVALAAESTASNAASTPIAAAASTPTIVDVPSPTIAAKDASVAPPSTTVATTPSDHSNVFSAIARLQAIPSSVVERRPALQPLLPRNPFAWYGDDAIDLSASLVGHPLLVATQPSASPRETATRPLLARQTTATIAPRPSMVEFVDIFDAKLAVTRPLLPRREAVTTASRSTMVDYVDIFDPALALARASDASSPTVASASTIPSLAPAEEAVPATVAARAAANDPDTIVVAMARQRTRASDAAATPIVVPPAAKAPDLVREIPLSRTAPATPALVFEADENRIGPLQGQRIALADARLDEMRGGFEADNGLKVSFGIERAVYINGNLVTSTSLNVADLSRLTAGQAQAMGLDRSTLGIIQSGPNNAFAPGQIGASSVATVIQNSLNDQRIQGITQINATVNSLDLIRKTNIQQNIQNALTDSIRR